MELSATIEERPFDRLTSQCEQALGALEDFYDHEHQQLIVLIDDQQSERGGLGSRGYQDAGELLERLLSHARGIAAARGLVLSVHER